MRRTTLTLRAIALMGAASAGIHQLRYAIAYGAGAHHALAEHPHGYLSLAMPGVLTALLIALGGVLMRAAGGRIAAVRRPAPTGIVFLWIVCAVALAAIYASQETLEGAGAFAGSGWIGIALALPAGLLVALGIGGAHAAEAMSMCDPLLRLAVAAVERIRVTDPPQRARLVAATRGARGPPVSFAV